LKKQQFAMPTSSIGAIRLPLQQDSPATIYKFGEGNGDSARNKPKSGALRAEHEDLPYKVELWDEAQASVVQTLAITANGSIGFAAYYAATREFPDRHVTLRHKDKIISRSSSPSAT
jgi:hypothetical protein